MYTALNKPLEEIEQKLVAGKGRYKKMIVNDSIVAFDTETTSWYWDGSGEPVVWSATNPKMLIPGTKTKMHKGATQWIWTLNFEGNVFYGRTLEDFEQFLKDWHAITHDLKFVYIHNLDFDFQFLLNILKVRSKNVFATKSHAPLYVWDTKYNVEFRDSYQLTHLSLDAWGKVIGLEKLTGTMDYNVIRTPLTPIKEDSPEFKYAVRDVEVMYVGLKKYRAKYDYVYNIPLTQTGELRRELQSLFKNCKKYTDKCHKSFPRTKQLYDFLDRAFWGGVVIANPNYRAETQKSHVVMKDISSSYPWALISEKFPIGTPIYCTDQDLIKKYMSDPDYGCFVEIRATNVQSKTECLNMSTAHIYEDHGTAAINGRLVSTDVMYSTMYDLDLELFKKFYTYDDLFITSCAACKLEYLPKSFRKFVIELYKNKTQYKDVTDAEVPGAEELYSKSKQFINSCFGVFVQRLLKGQSIFDPKNSSWSTEKLDDDLFARKLDDVLYRDGNPTKPKMLYILPQVGCAITAVARQNLFAGYGWDEESQTFLLDNYMLYTDTDSIKYLDNPYAEDVINKYNETVMKKHQQIADQLGIDVSDLSPLDPKGKPRPIGIFADDGETDELKYLGSKKYIYRGIDKDTGESVLKMTLAGVPKIQSKLLDDDIDNFAPGFEFKAAAAINAGLPAKLTPYYLNDIPHITFPDGYTETHNYGICLMPTPYKLDLGLDTAPDTDEFNRLLNYYKDNTALQNNIKIKKRGPIL